MVTWLKKNVHPLDLVYKLAEDHAVVLLNGRGFDAPNWSVRVSFANLADDSHDDIGRAARAVTSSPIGRKARKWVRSSSATERIRQKATVRWFIAQLWGLLPRVA
jgi:hypothetical protein